MSARESTMLMRAWCCLSFCFVLLLSKAGAHPADVSQLRVRIDHQRIDFRFSLNIATLARLVVIDANQDNKVVYAEIEKAVPIVRDFLTKSVLVSIDDEDAAIGEFKGFECVWPDAQASEITPPDAGQRFVDFNFTEAWPKGIGDVWLGFQIFEQFGDLHTVQCVYQQPGEHDTPVEFNIREPEYLYDTGWTAGEVPKAVESSPATAPSTAKRVPVWLIMGGLLAGALVVWSVRRRP